MFRYLLVFAGLVAGIKAFAQDSTYKKPPLQGLNISGSYRFFLQHRYFTDPYVLELSNSNPVYLPTRSILVGDATQLPELTLQISGKPTKRTSFGTDLVVWNQNTGLFDYYKGLQLGINLYGDFETPWANVGIKAGGVHWHSMTPFTMKSFAGYNRYSIFDRNPWDPQFNDIGQRYSDYYKKGAVSQDQRWGNQAFQGILVDLTEMPLGFDLNLMYGRTANAGSAFLSTFNNDSTNNQYNGYYQSTVPNDVVGGRLVKHFGKSHISLNSFNKRSYSDVLATEAIDNNVHTTEFLIDLKPIQVEGELGVGKYADKYIQEGYGSLASIKLRSNPDRIKLPIELHAYRLSPKVVNTNAEFVNTSVAEASSASTGSQLVIGANGVLQQTGSAMLPIGQMANNRMGVNLNTDIKIKDLILTVGHGMAKEIEKINDNLTYGHMINGLTMSQFWRWSFPSNVGPYNRMSVLFRGVYETVYLRDLSLNGEVINDKYFNNLEIQMKYKFKLFGKPWHMFYLGAYNSVQPMFSPITVFNEKAYIRYYAHQFEQYYQLHPKLVLANYLGWERAIANYATQVDIDSRRPRNQEGLALGLGFDYMMARNTGLYLRHRFFKFNDRSFALDHFSGQESTLEVKIFF